MSTHLIEPNDPAADADTYCYFCGRDVGDCTCPECAVCQVTGDPDCLLRHEYGPLVLDAVRAKTIRDAEWAVYNAHTVSTSSEFTRGLQVAISRVNTLRAQTQKGVGGTALKLYVWEDFAPDFTVGLAFAIAEDRDEARDMISADGNDYLRWFLGATPKVYELDTLVAPLAFSG